VVLKFGAIAAMWNFPLDEQTQRALQTTIENRAVAQRGA
jgi:hypothetical protein